MVKLHLPHMYMFLLIVSKEKIISIYSTISPNFSILLGSYVTFSSPSRRIVWVRSNFFKDTICFFVALTAKHPESSATFRQSDIIINFLTILVPLPTMAVELNQNYLEIPKTYSDTFFVCKSIVNTFTSLVRGTQMVRKLVKRLVRGSGRIGMLRSQSHKKKQKVSLKKLESDPKNLTRRS